MKDILSYGFGTLLGFALIATFVFFFISDITQKKHGVLRSTDNLPIDEAKSMDCPVAGASSREGVASRTLLLGPAGGFYSASSEDVYPNCWSAVFAADAMRKALKEPHLQDALQHGGL